jgi:hypothetical protein
VGVNRKQEHELGAVLLLHGLALSPRWMILIARDLRKAGFGSILNLGYRRGPDLAQISADLGAKLPQRLPEGVLAGKIPLHCIALSMGGLIMRQLLADGALPAHPGARYVTLGTPHAGARKAIWARKRIPRASRLFLGPCLTDIEPGSAFLTQLQLPPLDRTLTIYSGTGTSRGRSRVLDQDNDGTIEVSSACLPGAQQLFLPDIHHWWISFVPQVRAAAVEFLLNGKVARPSAVPQAGGRG